MSAKMYLISKAVLESGLLPEEEHQGASGNYLEMVRKVDAISTLVELNLDRKDVSCKLLEEIRDEFLRLMQFKSIYFSLLPKNKKIL